MAISGLYRYDVQVLSLRRGMAPIDDDAGTLTVTNTSDGAVTLFADRDGGNSLTSPLTLKDGRASFWTANATIKLVAAVTVPITQTITATNWTPNDHVLVASDPIS